jgi:hypothetical protein
MPFHIAFARGSARGHDHQSPALAAELQLRDHRVSDAHRLGTADRLDLVVWRDPAGLELARRWAIPDVRLAVDPVDPDDPQPTIACFPRAQQPRGELVADHVLFAGRLGRAHERPQRHLDDPVSWRMRYDDEGSGGVVAAAEWIEALLEPPPRPTADDLFEAVLLMADERGAEEDEPRRELLRRADHATFSLLCRELESPDPDRRGWAAALLGGLGGWTSHRIELCFWYRPFRTATVDRLIALAAVEEDEDVLVEIGEAFGNLDDPRAIPVLLTLKDHPDEDVRWAVVQGLLGLDDDRAVAALIELSTDEDDDVRDWATFGIGSQIDRDTPEIRAALMARLDDPAARDEAIDGLVERGLMTAPPDEEEDEE